MFNLNAMGRARDQNSGAWCAPADRTDRFTLTGPLFSCQSLRSNVRDFQYSEWYVDPVLKKTLSDAKTKHMMGHSLKSRLRGTRMPGFSQRMPTWHEQSGVPDASSLHTYRAGQPANLLPQTLKCKIKITRQHHTLLRTE
jgi:hypothetical protein